MFNPGWTFRTKLTSVIFLMIVTAVGGSSLFFVKLYKKDKLNSILQSELNFARQTGSHLSNLLTLADVIEIDKARNSDDIIMIYDDPCIKASNPHGVVSIQYQSQLSDIGVEPSTWLDSLALFKICSVNAEQVGLHSLPLQNLKATIVPNKVQIMEPYMGVLTQSAKGRRFALLSMNSLGTSAFSTTFIVNANGETIWSADGVEYVQTALTDSGIKYDLIKNLVQESISQGKSGALFAGESGLLTFTKVTDDWVMFSLSYLPTILKPVQFALTQSMLLAAGFIFLCLFIGKNIALLVTRPLQELRSHAERVGQGDFETRISVKGKDEISIVKNAFNVMTEKIIQLIEDTKEKTNIERELQLAEQIQKMLIPQVGVELSNYSLHSHIKSASQCGGDWWGYLELKRPGLSSVLVMMVGDVTGHGTSSALITAAIRGGLSLLSSWAEENKEIGSDPRLINQFFNRVVYEAAKGVIGMTFFTAVIEPKSKRMYCSNAGHNLPYLITPNVQGGKPVIKAIGRPGIPLGYAPDTVYSDLDTYEWKEGSQIFLYTDGLIDCNQGDKVLYDRKSLRKALNTSSHLQGSQLLEKILNNRKEIIKDLPAVDDVTAIICSAKEGE
jgi:serine phosphatase RsbU (regulator of sigma subunit)